MSTTVAVAKFDLSAFRVSRGVSPESEKVRELELEYKADRQRPVSFAWRDLLLGEIRDIIETCSNHGWDGYDASPISSDSAGSAVKLIQNLPEGFQTPVVVPEPDGDIALEWQSKGNRIFSLSVTGRTLVYAGRFGGASRQHGEESFFGVIPRTILEVLAEHFPAA